MPDLLDRLRKLPKDRARPIAEGVLDLLRFFPYLRANYDVADLAFLESICKNDGPTHYNKHHEDQPRDSQGRWTISGRADLPKLAKTLEPYRHQPLSPEDAEDAVVSWLHLRHDYGAFVPEVLEDRANEVLAEPWHQRRSLAIFAWMVDRARRESGKMSA